MRSSENSMTEKKTALGYGEDGKEEKTALSAKKLIDVCCRYLYLRERSRVLFERITRSGARLEASFGRSRSGGAERALAVLADIKEELRLAESQLLSQQKRLCRIIRLHPNLSGEVKQTLLLRVEEGCGVREIAKRCGRCDSAIVKRLKKGALILTGEKEEAERLYNYWSMLHRMKEGLDDQAE